MDKNGILLCIYLILSGCYCVKSDETCTVAQLHAEKLRRHFSGKLVEDVSTLIQETKTISSQLKAAGLKKQANEFDSYVDVLMFGNRTIDESLNDVMTLVKQKKQVCTPCQRVNTKIQSLF